MVNPHGRAAAPSGRRQRPCRLTPTLTLRLRAPCPLRGRHWRRRRSVLQAIVRHVDFALVKCLVLAGPGFAKDQLKTYLDEEAVKRDLR